MAVASLRSRRSRRAFRAAGPAATASRSTGRSLRATSGTACQRVASTRPMPTCAGSCTSRRWVPRSSSDRKRRLDSEKRREPRHLGSQRLAVEARRRRNRDLHLFRALLALPQAGRNAVDHQEAHTRRPLVASPSVRSNLRAHAFGDELFALAEAHHVHAVLRQEANALLRVRELLVPRKNEGATPFDVELLDVHEVERHVGTEPRTKLLRPTRAVRVEVATQNFTERLLLVDVPPAFDPAVWTHERDLVPLRWALAGLRQEEGEARAEASLVLLPGAAHDFVGDLLAQERLPAERLPRRRLQLRALGDADRWMNDAVRVGPRRKCLRLPGGGAVRREPERQLVRRMQMQRAAQRPCLHERPVAPQRVAHVLLRDAVDARRELQLGRRLPLRVDAGDLPCDVDE